jgi:hypothetical protein
MTTARSFLTKSTAVGMALILGGCQTTNVGSILPGGYLSDESDRCYSQRAALDSTGNTFETEVLRNTLLGVGTGVVTALVTGEDPFAGAVIGGAAALAGTLIYNLQRENGNPVAVTEAAISGVRQENSRIDLLLDRFAALRACRRQEAADIRADLAADHIPRAVAEERMAGVRERYREDIEQLDRIARNIAERTDGYAAVYNQIAADNGGRQLVVDAPPQNTRGAGLRVLRTANLRAGPGTGYERVGQLRPGTPVRVLARENGWSRIANPSGGAAYIANFLIGTGSPARASGSGRIAERPAERPVESQKLDPVVLPARERDKVDDLQDVSLSNVEKRDRVYEELADSKAETDEFTLS